MNIFFLDRDPRYAASALCDKHLRKMLLETAQILCTVHHKAGTSEVLVPYKPTHSNHPCVVWAGSSTKAFEWVCDLGMWMDLEYCARYGKTHASGEVIKLMATTPIALPDTPFADPPQCMPDEFRGDDAVEAYRKYYAIGKRDVCGKYTNADRPDWLVEMRGE